MAVTIVPFNCKLDQGAISKGDIIYHRPWTENKVVEISKVAGWAILFFVDISWITDFFQTFLMPKSILIVAYVALLAIKCVDFTYILAKEVANILSPAKEVANILSPGCKIKEFLSTHERGEIYTTEKIFNEYLKSSPGIVYTEDLNGNANKGIKKYTFEKLS